MSSPEQLIARGGGGGLGLTGGLRRLIAEPDEEQEKQPPVLAPSISHRNTL